MGKIEDRIEALEPRVAELGKLVKDIMFVIKHKEDVRIFANDNVCHCPDHKEPHVHHGEEETKHNICCPAFGFATGACTCKPSQPVAEKPLACCDDPSCKGFVEEKPSECKHEWENLLGDYRCALCGIKPQKEVYHYTGTIEDGQLKLKKNKKEKPSECEHTKCAYSIVSGIKVWTCIDCYASWINDCDKPVKPSEVIQINRQVAEEWHLFQWDRIQNGNGTTRDNELHKAIGKALAE